MRLCMVIIIFFFTVGIRIFTAFRMRGLYLLRRHVHLEMLFVRNLLMMRLYDVRLMAFCIVMHRMGQGGNWWESQNRVLELVLCSLRRRCLLSRGVRALDFCFFR